MARSSKIPFTPIVCKRYDKGISFIVMTCFYFYLVSILTFVYIPEFRQHFGIVFTSFVYLLSLGLGLMSYWSFFKAATTNAGEIESGYVSPMPNPLERDKSIMPERNNQINGPEQAVETIYDRALKYYSEWAVVRENLDLNQTSVTDAENPGGFVLPADFATRNCIMNNYCYRHCNKCNIDQPPRSRHCDL